MLKELSFENASAILKYLVVVVIAWVVFILYIAKLNETGSDRKDVGVITGGVRSIVPTVEATIQANQAQVIQSAPLTNSSSASSENSLENSKVQLVFQTANEAIRQGDSELAMSVLVGLISQYPELPEPYANLASLQAANGQLAEARATLLQGLQTDKAYAALFSNLQKVQGALAANAYTSALVDQGQVITTVALPVLENIGLLEVSQQVDDLNQKSQAENPRLEEAVVELNVSEPELKTNN